MDIQGALHCADDTEMNICVEVVLADAVRRLQDDLDHVTAERDALREEMAKLMEQKPYAWDCGGDISKVEAYADWFKKNQSWVSGEVTPLYASPIPTAQSPVPEVLVNWCSAYGDYLQKLKTYNEKVTLSKTLPFPGLDMNDEYQAFTAAQNKKHRMIPDVYEALRALLATEQAGKEDAK